jgi:hypothetical protein
MTGEAGSGMTRAARLCPARACHRPYALSQIVSANNVAAPTDALTRLCSNGVIARLADRGSPDGPVDSPLESEK